MDTHWENMVLQQTTPTVDTEIHTLTFYWFTITPELICQLSFICLVKRPNDGSPCWLITYTSSLEEAYHNGLQTILIRAMLTLESIKINSSNTVNPTILVIGLDKFFSQCPPLLHSLHNWHHINFVRFKGGATGRQNSAVESATNSFIWTLKNMSVYTATSHALHSTYGSHNLYQLNALSETFTIIFSFTSFFLLHHFFFYIIFSLTFFLLHQTDLHSFAVLWCSFLQSPRLRLARETSLGCVDLNRIVTVLWSIN